MPKAHARMGFLLLTEFPAIMAKLTLQKNEPGRGGAARLRSLKWPGQDGESTCACSRLTQMNPVVESTVRRMFLHD